MQAKMQLKYTHRIHDTHLFNRYILDPCYVLIKTGWFEVHMYYFITFLLAVVLHCALPLCRWGWDAAGEIVYAFEKLMFQSVHKVGL